MYTRYYDNYEARARSARAEEAHEEALPAETVCKPDADTTEEIAVAGGFPRILSDIKADDIILIGLLILILGDGCDDNLLPLILGFLLISR